MKRGLVEVYALAVCFVTLVCFVIALGIGIYDLIQIVNPEFTISSYTYDRHQSNEAFLKNWPEDKQRLQGEELTRLRKESYQAALRSEKRGAIQSLTMVFIIILIDLVVYIIHWYVAKRARAMAEAS
jgi:predicted PurR-regulated permease PerM